MGIMDLILVRQWPTVSQTDYNALIAMKGALEIGLAEAHGYVDGHDSGYGGMHVSSVHTDLPLQLRLPGGDGQHLFDRNPGLEGHAS